jgi:hypothetical protein
MPDPNALPNLGNVPLRDLRTENPVLDAAVQRLIEDTDQDGDVISAFQSAPPTEGADDESPDETAAAVQSVHDTPTDGEALNPRN